MPARRWPRSRTERPSPATDCDAMLTKIVALFLVFVAVLGMFGKLRLLIPKQLQRTAKCEACGAPKVGKGPCPCGKG